jgi:hypothetical protein
MGTLPWATSEAYFSRIAEMKLWGLSAGRDGRMKEAVVGDLEIPSGGYQQAELKGTNWVD